MLTFRPLAMSTQPSKIMTTVIFIYPQSCTAPKSPGFDPQHFKNKGKDEYNIAKKEISMTP